MSEKSLNIVEASIEQLVEIAELVRQSITILCEPDHGGQPHNIENWLTDRTEDKLREIMASPDAVTDVAMLDGEVAGVSHITHQGMLVLCYIHPDHIGQGLGRQLLRTAEGRARSNGVEEIRLISTTTALEFYRTHGYRQYADHILQFGMPGYPMSKKICSE
ncbi:MAG: GNAT family N-acetyltransferase [Gammaproteobacteria bacterium]|nr:GNAT family N-acetyltransferase [Gammaproteobacteria bacterium]